MEVSLLLITLFTAVPERDSAVDRTSVIASMPRWSVAVESSPTATEADIPFLVPASNWNEVVVRAQSLDSPYYDELPPPGGVAKSKAAAPR